MLLVLALSVVPLAMAGVMPQQQMQWPVQQGWNGWQQSGWQQSGWGGTQQPTAQPTQGSNGAWWQTTSQEDYAAYLKWCEERRLAIQEQEAQKELLEQIKERAEVRKAQIERERAAKEMQVKRESMMAQWRQWQAQLNSAEEYDGLMEGFEEMKVKYMYKLLLEYLKFCRCNDYTSHLQRYLIHGDLSYTPATAEVFSLDELATVEVGNVDAVAQVLANLSAKDQTKAYFNGLMNSMCDSVRVYVDQVKSWEVQYNFMGV